MTVWEAYCDIKLRNLFKHEWLPAQGMSPAKAQDTMTKFKVYIDRLKSIPDVIRLREIDTVEAMMATLDEIFTVKWANHINTKYSDMPRLYRQYGIFLQALEAKENKRIQTGEAVILPDDMNLSNIAEVPISDIEQPYIKEDGKLSLITNPRLISLLYAIIHLQYHATPDFCIMAINRFYGQQFPQMGFADWNGLIAKVWLKATEKPKTKTGMRHYKIHLTMDKGIVDVTLSPMDALVFVIGRIGFERAESARFHFMEMPIVTRHIPHGKEKYYSAVNEQWFVLGAGDAKEKRKTIFAYSQKFNMDIKTEIVK